MRRNAFATTGIISAALALGVPAAASAGEFGAPSECPDPLIEQPFAPFGDARDFELAPGGAFDGDATDWRLNDERPRERRVAPAEAGRPRDRPQHVVRRSGLRADALQVPRIVRNPHAELRVEVRYPDTGGSWERVAGIEPGDGQDIGNGWTLSDDLDVPPQLGGSEPGWRHVQIRLRSGAARWKVDDVYVDPKRRS